eukprot:403356339
MHSILDEQLNNFNFFKSKPINQIEKNVASPTNNSQQQQPIYTQVRSQNNASNLNTNSTNISNQNFPNTATFASQQSNDLPIDRDHSSPFNYKNKNAMNTNVRPYVEEKNGCIDLIKVDNDFDNSNTSRWDSIQKSNPYQLSQQNQLQSSSNYNTNPNTQMKQSELMLLNTPDSLKLGTSSFGLKNSTVHKREDDANNTTNFMQSSIRGIIFNDESRRETLSNNPLLQNFNSHDKIKNLECKLTMVNNDDSSLLEELESQRNSTKNATKKTSKLLKESTSSKGILKQNQNLMQNRKDLASSRLRESLRRKQEQDNNRDSDDSNLSYSRNKSQLRQSLSSKRAPTGGHSASLRQQSTAKKQQETSRARRFNLINDTYDSKQNENNHSTSRGRQTSLRNSAIQRSQSFSKSKSRLTQQSLRDGPSFFDSVRHSTSSFLRSNSKKRPGVRDDSNDVKRLKDDLFLERKKNLELERQFEAFKKANMRGKDSGQGMGAESKLKQIKKDYKQLLEAFERSEKIRRDQKDLIHSLKKELNKFRREAQENQENQDNIDAKVKKQGNTLKQSDKENRNNAGKQRNNKDEENQEETDSSNSENEEDLMPTKLSKKKSSTITGKVKALKKEAMKKKF